MRFPAWIEAAVFFLAFFVAVPAVAVVIGRAAWLGKPKNWDRSMYWTAFVASVAASGFLTVYAQRMHAEVGTWRYPVQMALFVLDLLLFGVAGGCMAGIFTYGRGKGPIWRSTTVRSEHSTESVEIDHPDD